MLGFSRNEVFEPLALDLYERAAALVARLPENEPDSGELLRCHEVARVVGHFLGLPVMDGRYLHVPHSWLYFCNRADQPRRLRILDPYAVGRLPMVQLLDTEYSIPHDDHYRPDYPRADIRNGVVHALIADLEPFFTPMAVPAGLIR